MNVSEDQPVRAMYARLAREYELEPTVPDHGGGVVGDLFPFDISDTDVAESDAQDQKRQRR